MSWDNFLKSLETEGGKLVVLLVMIAFLSVLAVVMLWTGHSPQEAGRSLLVGAISSLLGILYGYLKAGGK
jgi:1,4-dihydroxy-2-naphthoate octaprenyltransferase